MFAVELSPNFLLSRWQEDKILKEMQTQTRPFFRFIKVSMDGYK